MSELPPPPPPYEEIAKSNKAQSARPTSYAPSSHLDVPRNGIPTLHRRSMEDEGRPLPPGWIRQYDAQDSHQFFVDTNADPPRSIWHHPYDDDTYLSTLSSEERETLEASATKASKADMMAESSADESDMDSPTKHGKAEPKASGSGAELPERPQEKEGGGLGKLGRKMKDTLTGSTHEERKRERERRAKEEQAAHERHQHIRSAMSRAAQTGQPQLLGKNQSGQDVYVEPPKLDAYGNHATPGAYGGKPAGSYQSYDPYTQGPYANPNNRFVPYPRPVDVYGRPYRMGPYGPYGDDGTGPYGTRRVVGREGQVMGGLLGGMLLGGLLF